MKCNCKYIHNFVIVDLLGRALLADFADSCGYVSGFLRPFAGACRLAGCALGALCRLVGQNRYRSVADTVFENRYRLNTFIFENVILRLLYRFVGQNRYRLVADVVYGNRSPDCVFSNGKRPTSYFSLCRSKSHYLCARFCIIIPNTESVFCRSCRSKTDYVIGRLF